MARGQDWLELIATQAFWGGVLASVFASLILVISGYLLRHTISAANERRERGRTENEKFEAALKDGSHQTPFVFVVVQGRALRFFLIAIFFAYVGDIIGEFTWPFHIVLYCVSLFFILRGLSWLSKNERRAIELIDDKALNDILS